MTVCWGCYQTITGKEKLWTEPYERDYCSPECRDNVVDELGGPA